MVNGFAVQPVKNDLPPKISKLFLIVYIVKYLLLHSNAVLFMSILHYTTVCRSFTLPFANRNDRSVFVPLADFIPDKKQISA
jgi:hypothetical protein